MADGISVSVDKANMQRIRAAAKDLPNAVFNGVRTGARTITRQMLGDAKSELQKVVYSKPRDDDERIPTGALASALDMKVKAKRKNGTVYAGVGIRNDKAVYDIKTKKKHDPIAIGRLVEYGHAKAGGGVVPPHPYMRPAEAKLGPDNGAAVLVDKTLKAVERAARKAAKGGGKR